MHMTFSNVFNIGRTSVSQQNAQLNLVSLQYSQDKRQYGPPVKQRSCTLF